VCSRIVYSVLSGPRNHNIDPSVYDPALHPNRQIGEIEVAPLERRHFANPQSQTLRHQNHRVIRFSQELRELPKLVVREDARRLLPFVTSLISTSSIGFLPSSPAHAIPKFFMASRSDLCHYHLTLIY
jgi:hypothetical protein